MSKLAGGASDVAWLRERATRGFLRSLTCEGLLLNWGAGGADRQLSKIAFSVNDRTVIYSPPVVYDPPKAKELISGMPRVRIPSGIRWPLEGGDPWGCANLTV